MGDKRTIGGPVPRGVEVLINKAAIDDCFKKQLLTDRHGAADAIALELTSSEDLLLNAIPNPQLEMIIDKTVVPDEHGFAAQLGVVELLDGREERVHVQVEDTPGGHDPGSYRPGESGLRGVGLPGLRSARKLSRSGSSRCAARPRVPRA